MLDKITDSIRATTILLKGIEEEKEKEKDKESLSKFLINFYIFSGESFRRY